MPGHPIVHVEISSKNLEESGKFYHELFGWEVEQIPAMQYATFTSGENSIGGGFNLITDGNPSGTIMFYVNTDNLDETLKKALSMGAKLVSPRMEIPGVGWFAVFTDLTGNKIGLLQPLMQA